MTSSTIQFSKMHGLGNDFVVIDAINQSINVSSLPAARIADRHLGIGCDQILVIESSTHADFFCRILNADGSEAEQCGNGLRCVARFVHENKLYAGHELVIETVAGLFPIEITDYEHIRVTLKTDRIANAPVQITLPTENLTLNGTSLALGNPHFIINVEDLTATPIKQIGPLLSTHALFPQGVNVGFVERIDPEHIHLRTYERGSGETHACGSNACAAVLAGILSGDLANAVNVEFKYGKLLIEWQGKSKPVLMTGPAEFVFTGKFDLKLK